MLSGKRQDKRKEIEALKELELNRKDYMIEMLEMQLMAMEKKDKLAPKRVKEN